MNAAAPAAVAAVDLFEAYVDPRAPAGTGSVFCRGLGLTPHTAIRAAAPSSTQVPWIRTRPVVLRDATRLGDVPFEIWCALRDATETALTAPHPDERRRGAAAAALLSRGRAASAWLLLHPPAAGPP